jgi:cytochrome c oxidase cbb3-type subunit IV
MNIIKEYMADVKGVDVFAIISMIIFILVFVLMVIHTFSLRKEDIKEFSNFPLEDEKEGNKNNNQDLNE